MQEILAIFFQLSYAYYPHEKFLLIEFSIVILLNFLFYFYFPHKPTHKPPDMTRENGVTSRFPTLQLSDVQAMCEPTAGPPSPVKIPFPLPISLLSPWENIILAALQNSRSFSE